MRGQVLRKLATSLVLLALCSVLIFVGLRLLPGDPTSILANNPQVTPSQRELVKQELGLDKSIPHQYLLWIAGVVTGDFGYTYYNPDFTTQELIVPRIFPTIELAVLAIVIALVLAVPLGVVAAMYPFGMLDRFVSGFAAAAIALPGFWVAILLIEVFAVRLGWFPTRGYVSPVEDPIRNLQSVFLPAVSLAIVLSGIVVRFLRASMLETVQAEFVRTAHGKGLLWRSVVLRHVFRNALLPTLTVVGLLVGSMLGGVVVTEYVFGWPGLGSLVLDAVGKRDYAVLQALLLLAAAAFILISHLVDLAAFALDPRLRSGV